jgi:hypothetical protein
VGIKRDKYRFACKDHVDGRSRGTSRNNSRNQKIWVIKSMLNETYDSFCRDRDSTRLELSQE